MDTIEQRLQRLEQIILSDKYLFEKPLIGGPNGLRLGSMAKDKLAFYNAAPIAQRSSANQATISGVNITQTTPWGFDTAANITKVINLVEEMRLTLIALGLFKGSA